MARTTIVMDDQLLQQVRERAAEKGWSLSKTIGELVKAGIHHRVADTSPGFTWRTFRGEVAPNTDFDDRDRLYELMEGRA